ncbi:MAG: hypothetical protein U1E76_03385 [Planctomycetota bacterium]
MSFVLLLTGAVLINAAAATQASQPATYSPVQWLMDPDAGDEPLGVRVLLAAALPPAFLAMIRLLPTLAKSLSVEATAKLIIEMIAKKIGLRGVAVTLCIIVTLVAVSWLATAV